MMTVVWPACAAAWVAGTANPLATVAAATRVFVSQVIIVLSLALSAVGSVTSSSYAFRKPNCHPAAGTDRRSQQRITDRLRRTRLTRSVAMLELVGLEFGDVRRELGVVAA